jgi:hypothetical protein
LKNPASIAHGIIHLRFAKWVLWLCCYSACLAAPFTYQGRLIDSGALANGSFELRLRLYDQLSGGTQIGADQTLATVPVTNGLFTVTLDFGGTAFDGNARWLEIAARRAGGSEAIEVLAPRQPVNAVPYAMFALESANDAATQVLIGQLVSTVNSLSNQLQTSSLAGLSAASSELADTNLLNRGFQRFQTLPPPDWRSGTFAGVPTARVGHGAVWTGSRLMIWGGFLGGSTFSANGAIYDPSVDLWTPISNSGAPSARRGSSAVWTGTSLLVWGGFNGTYLATGGEYVASSSTWAALPSLNAPAEREGHSTVWTGSRLVLFGGRNAGGLLADGAVFDPGTRLWSSLPTAGAPAARFNATAVWTGTNMVVWGGQGEAGEVGTGAILPIAGGTAPGGWTAMNASGALTARQGHSAVWTGQRILYFGGRQGGVPLGDGAAFDPVDNSWSPISSTGAPSARSAHSAVWTGSEMLIVGGETSDGTTAGGAAYNPSTGVWRTLSNGGSPQARSSTPAVWSGTELILFGGVASGSPLSALQRLDPQPAWYLYRKP